MLVCNATIAPVQTTAAAMDELARIVAVRAPRDMEPSLACLLLLLHHKNEQIARLERDLRTYRGF